MLAPSIRKSSFGHIAAIRNYYTPPEPNGAPKVRPKVPMTLYNDEPRERALWWATLASLCALLLSPLLLTDVPPVLDYPNHLARLMVLADGGHDPILTRLYRPNWGIIPDLGIDLIGVPLMWILPVHVAGRVILGLVLLASVLGPIAYGWAAAGRRTWWSLGCVLVAYNATFMQGFLNSTLGTGLAMLLAASWLRSREPEPRRALAIAIPGAVVLFFVHLMGVLFYGLLIGAYELTRLPALRRDPAGIARRVLFGVAVFAAPGALYLSSELHAMPGEIVFLPLGKKLAQLLMPFANYSAILDIGSAVAVTIVFVAAVATRRFRVPAASAVTLCLLVLLYCVSPSEFKGTYNLDMRFVIFLGFALFCGVAPTGRSARIGQAVLWAGAVLFAVRMAVVADVWLDHNKDLGQLRAVIAHAEPGNLVFVTDVKPEEEPEYWDRGPRARRLSNGLRMDPHWPALLLIERRAWWPYLFDNPSQQPIRTRQPYRALADQMVRLPPHRELEIPGMIGLCGFDLVLLMIAGGAGDPASFASDRLTLIEANDTAALYKVRANPGCPPLK